MSIEAILEQLQDDRWIYLSHLELDSVGAWVQLGQQVMAGKFQVNSDVVVNRIGSMLQEARQCSVSDYLLLVQV